ncbi:MAG: Flp pilus assembly protein CpaB [Candidatus Riflebacteria bacterium]|nr:Flp pilus assembly protein CpaB [Candidatus Riflebacteria bacterium]
MNRRAITFALVISLCISLVVWKKMKTATNAKVPVVTAEPPKPIVRVIVAKKRIPARTRLELKRLEEFLELREIVASAPPVGAYTTLASLTNRYTSTGMFPGDVLVEDRLMGTDAVPALSFAIPQGRRAYTIAVSPVTGVAGFLQQGDFVDIIARLTLPTGEPLSKVVLEDIQILAIGKIYEFDAIIPTSTPAISAGKSDLITLAVTPEELERLNLLETGGYNFKLILKNPKDKGTIVSTKGSTPKMLLTSLGLIEEEKPIVATPQAEIAEEQVKAPVIQEVQISQVIEEEESPTVEIFYAAKRMEMPKDITLKPRSRQVAMKPVAAVPVRAPSPSPFEQE